MVQLVGQRTIGGLDQRRGHPSTPDQRIPLSVSIEYNPAGLCGQPTGCRVLQFW